MIKIGRGKHLTFALLTALLPVLALLSTPTLAQQQGQGLEISPPLNEININPGETATVVIKVRNVSQGKLIAKAQVNDFVAEGEEGVPKLLLEENQQSSYSLKQFIKSIPDVEIAPSEQKTINVSVQVPIDAAPGGHYGAVRFTATPPELEGSGVSLSASIGTLILVNVSGELNHKLNLAEFFVSKDGARKNFYEGGPLSAVVRVQNSGNVHEKPAGDIKIKNIFGQEVAKLAVNEKGGNVLPDSVRKFEQTFDKKPMFGLYKAELNLNYAGIGLVHQHLSFWVIPYKLIAVAVAVLLIIAVAVALIRRRNHQDSGGAGSLVSTNDSAKNDDQIPPYIPPPSQL